MKTAIKLILIYLGLQLLSAAVVGLIIMLITLLKGGDAATNAAGVALAPSMLLAIISMFIYMWKANYIPRTSGSYSILSLPFVVVTLLSGISLFILMDFLTSMLSWIPNLMEEQFNMLQSGWLGILTITILGPVLEELLFRGGATRALLEKYSPRKAIFLSALLFGVFHLNPAQIVGAFFGGLVLAWVYYRTRSLTLPILIHILINSSSVFLTLRHPHIDSLKDLMATTPYYILIFLASALFVVCCSWIRRNTQNINSSI